MKTLKLILTAILLMMAYVANAQTIQFYKDGAVVKEYSSAEVDSVVYKPAAAEPRFYYYAGWDCPSSVEDLEDYVQNKDGRKGINYQCGYETDVNNINFNMIDPQNSIIGDDDMEEQIHFYVIIPNGIGIYTVNEINVTESSFNPIYDTDKQRDGYNIYQSKGKFWDIKSIKLHK